MIAKSTVIIKDQGRVRGKLDKDEERGDGSIDKD